MLDEEALRKLSEEVKKIDNELKASDPKLLRHFLNRLKELGDTPVISSEIQAKISAVQAQIEYAILHVELNPKHHLLEEEKKSDQPSEKDKIAEIVKEQNVAAEAFNDLLDKEGTKAFDKDGNEITDRTKLKAESGKQRENCTIAVKGGEGFEAGVAGARSMYKKFEGFEGLRFKEITVTSDDDKAVAHYFVIEVPEGYKGNVDPLTMKPEQIEELIAALKDQKTYPNRTFFTDSFVNSLEKEVVQDLQKKAGVELAKVFEVKDSEEKKGKAVTAGEEEPSTVFRKPSGKPLAAPEQLNTVERNDVFAFGRGSGSSGGGMSR